MLDRLLDAVEGPRVERRLARLRLGHGLQANLEKEKEKDALEVFFLPKTMWGKTTVVWFQAKQPFA